jgi:hypothetical protein
MDKKIRPSIKLIKRDLRTPEQDNPELRSNEEQYTFISGELFGDFWTVDSHRMQWIIADGKNLNDLVTDGALTENDVQHIERKINITRLANMTPAQRERELLKEELRKEMGIEKPKPAKRGRRKTNN